MQWNGILIWCEQDCSDSTTEATYELLSEGRKLANSLNQPLYCVAVADKKVSAKKLSIYGAEKLFMCEHELFKDFSIDGYAKALVVVINKIEPSIVLFAATHKGRVLAPTVAARFKAGITADCTEFDIDDNGRLVQIRPALGGNILASIVAPESNPQFATVRPGVFKKEKIESPTNIEIVPIDVKIDPKEIRSEILETIIEVKKDSGIETANIIVAVGRGIEKKENLVLAGNLASKLNGTLAASRAVVELGWVDHTRQVGQSGKTVSPKLYIAIGISGAVQHIAGMSGSDKIIAINKDPQAPIFGYADLGIVGDFKEIYSHLINRLINNLEKL